MKIVKVFASLMFVLVLCSAFTMEKKGNGVYIAGVSASFTDSLVYFTDIQFIGDVQIGKDGLLPHRQDYSSQLDTYVENTLGVPNRVCFIYFNKKKSKLEKTLKTMKEKYKEGGKSILRETGAEFKFSDVVE